MKYIRTKKGKIVDIEKFINEEKDTPYYKDFEFEEITKDGELKWTAVGTEKCSIKDQIGSRCHFSATLNSEIIKQANNVEELCDYVFYRFIEDNELEIKNIKKVNMRVLKSWYKNNIVKDVMFAILTDKGLIYVAKMNKDKGEPELI